MVISSALVGVRPPNDELQRTSDGNAAGSPLSSVLARPRETPGGVRQ
jgi:hypothetical protein